MKLPSKIYDAVRLSYMPNSKEICAVLNLICDVACQNQAFVSQMSCRVMILLGKNVILAFVCYSIYVSMLYQSKVMLFRTSCSSKHMQKH